MGWDRFSPHLYSRDVLTSMPMRVVPAGPERDRAAHDHDFFEVALVASGHAVHACAGGRRALKPGDALIVRPGAWHSYHECQNLILYNCIFLPDLVRNQLAWLREDRAVNQMLWRGPLRAEHGISFLSTPTDEVQRHLRHLTLLPWEGPHPSLSERPRSISAATAGLALFLSDLAWAAAGEEETPTTSSETRLHPAVAGAVRMLETRYHAPWTLDRLSEAMQIDPYYLSRLFRKCVGVPPMTYLARCRAERAASLLLGTDRPIKEIAAAVGWGSLHTFGRQFRAHFAISASAYRRKFQRAK
jgi:AraC family L-rhamnose operon transcriptional activator RhaR